jgi:transposase-like protein
VLEPVASGRKVADVARDLGVTGQTICNWRRQERIDRGDEAGLTTSERGELAAAKCRIRELETELQIHRHSTELLKGSTDPRGGGRRSR